MVMLWHWQYDRDKAGGAFTGPHEGPLVCISRFGVCWSRHRVPGLLAARCAVVAVALRTGNPP